MHRLLADRVDERDLVGMEANATIWIGTWKSVFQIALDVHTAGGKLASDLMVSSGKKLDVKKTVLLRLTNLLIGKASLLEVCLSDTLQLRSSSVRGRTIGKALVLGTVTVNEMAKFSTWRGHRLVHNGPVPLVHLTLSEHLAQAT